MRYLKRQSSGTILIGPVIKSTDGYSPLQGMTSALIDINFWMMSSNGTLSSQDYTLSNTFTTYGNGYIGIGYVSSNVSEPGNLRIEINASASGIPTFDDFQVVNGHIFDALYCSSGVERLQTDAWEITGTGITSASVMMGVNVIQMASAAVSTVTAQIAVNTVMISSVIATQNTIGTGTIYDTMDHGTLMRYLQAYAIGDFGATGISTNVLVYKNYANTTVGGGAMSHTFTTKTREWSSA
jgi:hypothetical protein